MYLKNMNNLQIDSPLQSFKSTNVERDFMNEFTTSSSMEIDTTDESLENDTDLTFIIYGIGGVLIFFAVFAICYKYCIKILDADDRQESEITRLRERSIPFRRAPDNNRIFNEDFAEAAIPNTAPKQVASFYGLGRNRQNRDVEQGAASNDSETTFSFPSVLHSQDSIASSDGLEDIFRLNYPSKRVADCGSNVNLYTPGSSPSTDEFEAGWLMEAPASFSSPRGSREGKLFSEENRYPTSSSFRKEFYDCKTDEKYPEAFKVDSSENVVKQSPKRKSRSSPTSPDVRRRRFPSFEGTPQRPSSWR